MEGDDNDSQQLIHTSSTRSLYRRRWGILATASAINVCNAGIWISYASVSDRAAGFYHKEQNDIDFFSSVFFMATIFVGLFAMWIVDRNGLALGLYLGSILTALGITVRALSSASFVVKWLSLSMENQYMIAIIGQAIAGCAQPFVLFTPTKVAEFWFPTNQRALATTITGMSNPIGIVLGNIVSPLIVTTDDKIPFMSTIWCIPSAVALILTILFVRSSKPPTPPSNSAEVISSTPYFTGIKELFSQKAFLLLMLCMGSGIGMFSALVTILEEIMKTKGYGDRFASDCIAYMIGSGIIGAALVSYVIDKNKEYIPAMKLAVGLSAISLNGLLASLNYSKVKSIVATFSAIFGFFGFMTYPLGLELGIECSFPVVQEATTSGLLMLSGQLQGILFIYLTTQTAKENVEGMIDYKYSLIMLSSVLVFISCLFILLFYTEYKRLKCEVNSNFRNIQHSLAISDVIDNSTSIFS